MFVRLRALFGGGDRLGAGGGASAGPGVAIAARAAHVGFDWENAGQVLEKLDEELAEFEEARRRGRREELEDELGDLLFVLVNLARFVKVDPEQALRKTNAKFRERFGYIERRLRETGRSLAETPIEEMEVLWQESKK